MKVVVDTNVVISGVFFGGRPRQILEAVVKNQITACATTEIISEYDEIIEEMIYRKQGKLRRDILSPFIAELELVAPVTQLAVCRDVDDDKFISCAVDTKAFYIISGDKDLLDIQQYQNIEIITAAEFCQRFLAQNSPY